MKSSGGGHQRGARRGVTAVRAGRCSLVGAGTPLRATPSVAGAALRAVAGWRTAAVCTLAAGALLVSACQLPVLDDEPGTGGSAGTAGAGGATSAGGSSGTSAGGTTNATGGTATGGTATGGTGGTITIVEPGDTGGTLSSGSGLEFPGIGTPPTIPCSTAGDGQSVAYAFCDQVVWNVAPAARVLYSWTTAEQAAELRADRVLLTRTETPGLGRGYAFTSIDELAARGNAPENQLLAKLSSELFTKVRYAWPHAWATRMGWPGEDYGDQLLRIVLKPEAWIVVVSDRVGMVVIDLQNQIVPIEDALANSERIGAIFFYKVDVTGQGTFHSCSGGYREFIVGNEAMIEEWSLGTEQIRAELEQDAARLEAFFELVRPAPPSLSSATYNAIVVCNWDFAPSDDVGTYERSLSIPSDYYVPLPAELAALVETLRASLFEPDPLVVTPGGSP